LIVFKERLVNLNLLRRELREEIRFSKRVVAKCIGVREDSTTVGELLSGVLEPTNIEL
jgi:hypothetical protein